MKNTSTECLAVRSSPSGRKACPEAEGLTSHIDMEIHTLVVEWWQELPIRIVEFT